MGLFDTDSSAGSNSESSGGSILTRKTGPLANWVWMALLLLVALGFSLWQRNKAAVEPDANVDTTTTDTALDNQTPPPVFILPQNPQPTVPVNVVVNNPANPAPATPPAAPPVAVKPAPTNPAPTPKPPAKPAPASYATVTVSKYTTKNPPWNSTLWGIAKHYGYGATNTNFNSIWNDPKNAALKKKRGQPTKIQPGDKIYVKLR